MINPYSEEALWLKAKLFLSHAMDDDAPRTFDERALWASLALELLAKAALARVSPLLIASPQEDGHNLLVASGLIEGDSRFITVAASTLYSRCSKAFRTFSEPEAKKITAARNEYLHGGAAAFALMPSDAWWPRYWAQAIVLVNAQDKTIEDLVGPQREAMVEGHLAQNKRNIESRVEMLIERAKQRYQQYRDGTMTARLAAEWERPVDLTAGLAHQAEATCPACGSTGVLEGEDVVRSEVRTEAVDYHDVDVWVDLTIGADHFSCNTCRLVIDRFEFLEAADLPLEISATGEYGDYMEPDYGND